MVQSTHQQASEENTAWWTIEWGERTARSWKQARVGHIQTSRDWVPVLAFSTYLAGALEQSTWPYR